jgi:manganese/zinc/iron transport system permease protein
MKPAMMLGMRDDNKRTALLCACCVSDNAACAAVLLENGADVDAGDGHGVRPLHLAAMQGDAGLMAALLITPAAGARFLTNNIKKMLLYAGSFGFASGVIGVFISYSGTGMPTGPWIVVVLSLFALVAIIFGKEKGMYLRMKMRVSNNVKINNENVLKDIYKLAQDGENTITINDLIEKEKYPPSKLKSILKRLERDRHIDQVRGFVILSDNGRIAARAVIRKHRLWEIYLSKYFQLEEDHVHDDAEGIEHVITPEIEKHLIKLLDRPETDPHQSEIPY